MEKEKKEKKSFKELWADKQSKAVIKLIMWLAFFVIMFLFLLVSSLFTKNNKQYYADEAEEKVDVNMVALLSKLKDSNYSYEYKVINGDDTYTLSGTKEEEEIGFYEKNNEIIKYQVIDHKFYKFENIESKEEIVISENDLKYLNIDNLIDEIKKYEEENQVLNEENNYTYNINENYIITINKKGNNINEVNIKIDSIEYDLLFKNIVTN